VILTNANLSARKLLALHNGRGAQEGLFAELKSQTQMDNAPCNRRAANQTWLLPAIQAHNLSRELQMSAERTHPYPCRLGPVRRQLRVRWTRDVLRPMRTSGVLKHGARPI
jgi:hypothetical protein